MTVFPATDAKIPVGAETVNGPTPPDRVLVAPGAPQALSVTVDGLATSGGQAPAPAPEKVTVTLRVVEPSVMPTVTGTVLGGGVPDGMARRMATVLLPLSPATTVPLLDEGGR